MSLRALLVDGPAEGRIVESDGAIIYWPVLRPSTTPWTAESETPPDPQFDKAEYRVDRLPSAQWDDEGREYNAIGVYIQPPLECGHSRDRGLMSAYVTTRDLFRAYSEMPEYRRHAPILCKTCGLILEMRHSIDLIADAEGWNRYRRGLLEELGRVVSEMEWIASRRSEEQ